MTDCLLLEKKLIVCANCKGDTFTCQSGSPPSAFPFSHWKELEEVGPVASFTPAYDKASCLLSGAAVSKHSLYFLICNNLNAQNMISLWACQEQVRPHAPSSPTFPYGAFASTALNAYAVNNLDCRCSNAQAGNMSEPLSSLFLVGLCAYIPICKVYSFSTVGFPVYQ